MWRDLQTMLPTPLKSVLVALPCWFVGVPVHAQDNESQVIVISADKEPAQTLQGFGTSLARE
jgi:hypothetical protein